MSKALRTQISAAVVSVRLASAAHAAGSTKDVVLDQLALAPSILTRMGVAVPATMKAAPFMI
mgnify:CR=1 FL=1